VKSGDKTIKGVASFSKTCYAYIFDRATGKPLNPIIETAVPTHTDIPGDEPWPTQPIPYSARGVPQTPFCATYPVESDPELAKLARPIYTPHLANEFVITAPGPLGGANFGASSFSPRTGLLYVTGKNSSQPGKVKPIGDGAVLSGKWAAGGGGGVPGKTSMATSSSLAAYNPVSGELVWYRENEGRTNSGNLVTGGDVVFQGLGINAATIINDGIHGGSYTPGGSFLAFDARTGESLWKVPTKAGIRSDPLTYQVNGKQYVAVIAGRELIVYALP